MVTEIDGDGPAGIAVVLSAAERWAVSDDGIRPGGQTHREPTTRTNGRAELAGRFPAAVAISVPSTSLSRPVAVCYALASCPRRFRALLPDRRRGSEPQHTVLSYRVRGIAEAGDVCRSHDRDAVAAQTLMPDMYVYRSNVPASWPFRVQALQAIVRGPQNEVENGSPSTGVDLPPGRDPPEVSVRDSATVALDGGLGSREAHHPRPTPDPSALHQIAAFDASELWRHNHCRRFRSLSFGRRQPRHVGRAAHVPPFPSRGFAGARRNRT